VDEERGLRTADKETAPDEPRPAGRSGLPPRLITDLLAAAVSAPSMHNTQPWRFRVRRYSHVIELRADPARALPYGDADGRAIHIACGAALLNLRLAAAVAGREPVVKLLPDPLEPVLLASVRLAGPYRALPAERELYAAIGRRHTNRLPFSDRPVPPGVLAEFVEAARVEGAILHVLDHDETIRVLGLVKDSEREQLADPDYRAELARWAGGARDRDGIPDSALGPHAFGDSTPVREFTPGQPGSRGYAWFEKAPQLVVLSVHMGDRASWLRAGQALQRVLLTATARGIAASPLTQPLETADAWQVRDPRSGHEQPQMILRMGYGLPVPASPRRPVSQVLN